VTPAPLTLAFDDIGAGDISIVGGKGANLGALSHAGIPVPPGFCATTSAYQKFIAQLPDSDARFAELEKLDGTDVDAARRTAEATRGALDKLPVPADVAAAVKESWRLLGADDPLAVRSSATAEDLPGASFAGQQDTYLNVRGETALMDAVRRCWISLFTDRAVLYRARNGFGHRDVGLAVVVQKLVDPDVSGILFTADPVSGNRNVVSIDAGFGLGEALVSGLIEADLYKVEKREAGQGTREGQPRILLARAGDKAFAIRSVPGGGTRQAPLPESIRKARALSDEQVIALAELGERVEEFYDGVPQDIEWCIAGGKIFVVQARPITSLFPIPQSPAADAGLRIFLSFGHVQMMLDALPRVAIDVLRLFIPAGKDRLPTLSDPPKLSPYMLPAASRIFIDVTPILRVRRARKAFLDGMTVVYADLGRAVKALTDRPEFNRRRGNEIGLATAVFRVLGPVFRRLPVILLTGNPVARARRFDVAVREIPAAAAQRIGARGSLTDRVRQCAIEMNSAFGSVTPFLPSMVAGLLSHRLLVRAARDGWATDVRGEVDNLLRGLPGNVTTEMDLAVGDLTDRIRAHPQLVAALDGRPWPEARRSLLEMDGGKEFIAALDDFLDRYGDRTAGEIDISRPRWRDDPSLLLRVIAGGLSGEAGAHRRQHRAQVEIGETAQRRLVAAARRGPKGIVRGWWIARLCRVARAGLGVREHPKFMIVRLMGVVRPEVIAAGGELARRGQISDPRQVWHVGIFELADALADPKIDLRTELVARVAQFNRDKPRRPPIAIASDGEIPSLGEGREGIPPNALAGTAASAGVAEGIAHVITDPQREVLEAGEILVAPFTDPGWTPLFIHAAGVVTEVGGLMTHGAVVAREYGIPAVVSVAGATERIRTGQRIRVDGSRGFVEIISDATTQLSSGGRA
jgi:pyruvate,water dikinase